LLYVRSGNAYRPGTTNPQLPLEFQSLKPEHVTDVEIGVKSDWTLYGVHARTNADVFHTHYKDIQVQRTVTIKDASGTLHSVSIVQNAASSDLEGGELEATFVPITGLEISPKGAYIFTNYNGDYPDSLGPPGTTRLSVTCRNGSIASTVRITCRLILHWATFHCPRHTSSWVMNTRSKINLPGKSTPQAFVRAGRHRHRLDEYSGVPRGCTVLHD